MRKVRPGLSLTLIWYNNISVKMGYLAVVSHEVAFWQNEAFDREPEGAKIMAKPCKLSRKVILSSPRC